MAPVPEPWEVSTDPARLDHDFICAQLATTYWAGDRPRAVVVASLRTSLCFGAYDRATGRQVGFGRVVTDGATFSWICDVIVDPSCRGQGIGKRLMFAIVTHPAVRGTNAMLGTKDAHGLYERYGFRRREMMRRAAEEPLPPSP
jgi:GNAT superfamily N-acetyltransferase